MKRFLLALICVLALCGFVRATVGADFRDANVIQLKVGESTLSDAVALLGRGPDESRIGASGATGYSWSFTQSKGSIWSGNVKTQSKSIALVFNTNGTFQRILDIRGFSIPAGDVKRLMSDPAAAIRAAKNTEASSSH